MAISTLSIPEIKRLTGLVLVYHASLSRALPVQGSKPVIEKEASGRHRVMSTEEASQVIFIFKSLTCTDFTSLFLLTSEFHRVCVCVCGVLVVTDLRTLLYLSV